jgi:hypothetical protein
MSFFLRELLFFGGIESHSFQILFILPTFTFRHVFVSPIEFRPLLGPEARALRAKTMRHGSFSGSGGQFKCGMPIAECGMKKESKKIRNPKPAIRNNWADAFSAQRPCFRATSLLFRRKGNRKSEVGKSYSFLDRKGNRVYVEL